MSFPSFRRSWDISEEFLRNTFTCNAGASSSLHQTPNQVARPASPHRPPRSLHPPPLRLPTSPATTLFGQALGCNSTDKAFFSAWGLCSQKSPESLGGH